MQVKDLVQGFLVSRSMTPQWMSGSNSLSDNLLFKNFLLLEPSSDFFSRVGVAGSPLPFRICPGEGKVGFGIEGQLRPGLTAELTGAGQAGPTVDFSSVPSIFGCVLSTFTEGAMTLPWGTLVCCMGCMGLMFPLSCSFSLGNLSNLELDEDVQRTPPLEDRLFPLALLPLLLDREGKRENTEV